MIKHFPNTIYSNNENIMIFLLIWHIFETQISNTVPAAHGLILGQEFYIFTRYNSSICVLMCVYLGWFCLLCVHHAKYHSLNSHIWLAHLYCHYLFIILYFYVFCFHQLKNNKIIWVIIFVCILCLQGAAQWDDLCYYICMYSVFTGCRKVKWSVLLYLYVLYIYRVQNSEFVRIIIFVCILCLQGAEQWNGVFYYICMHSVFAGCRTVRWSRRKVDKNRSLTPTLLPASATSSR